MRCEGDVAPQSKAEFTVSPTPRKEPMSKCRSEAVGKRQIRQRSRRRPDKQIDRYQRGSVGKTGRWDVGDEDGSSDMRRNQRQGERQIITAIGGSA